MELEAMIQNLMHQAKQQRNSRNLQQQQKCSICNGTTWVLNTEGKYTRCQCYSLEENSIRFKNSGIDPKDTTLKINSYKAYDNTTKIAKSVSTDYVKRFEEIRCNENNWLMLCGQSGAGKSHLCISIGLALLNRGYSVYYASYLETLQKLRSNYFDEEGFYKELGKVVNADILILDDLFKDKFKNNKLIGDLDKHDMKVIQPLINQRYTRKAITIISCEGTLDMIQDLDYSLAGRIIQRCDRRIVEFKGERLNYRIWKGEA